MANCTYCGSEIPKGAAFCPNCGGKLTEEEAPAKMPEKEIIMPSYSTQQQGSYQPPVNNPQSSYQPTYYSSSPAPVSTGGMLAWSIITLLLCTIPGIVALINVANVNKAETVEEQEKKLSTAKTWCIIGTVLGILAVIGTIAQNSYS